MSKSSHCPLCSSLLLRHIRSGKVYWLCQSCRQEVPALSAIQTTRRSTPEISIPQIQTMRNTHEYAID
jgi:ribosomal protein L37AE/L43A